MEISLINNQIEREIVSKSCEIITGNLLILKKSEPTNNKTNHRSYNLLELNINKQLMNKIH